MVKRMKKSVIFIVATIFLLAMAGCGCAISLEPVETSASENLIQLLAFVDESLTEQEAIDLEGEIWRIAEVESVRFVSREEAFEDFLATLDDDLRTHVEELADATSLRHRFMIDLGDAANIQDTQTLLMQISGIADVIVDDIYSGHTE